MQADARGLGAGAAQLPRRHRDRAATPASTLKVLTAAAALQHLGPEFRHATAVQLRRPALADERGAPLVTLVGAGDASLTRDDVRALAETARATLRRLGFAQVLVCADASAFRHAGAEPCDEWMSEDLDGRYGAMPSALVVDGNVAHLEVTAAPVEGAPPRVRCTCACCAGTQPASRVDAHGVRVVVGASDGASPSATPSSSACGVRYSRPRGAYVVHGSPKPGASTRLAVPVLDAQAWAAHCFAHALGVAGVESPTVATPTDLREAQPLGPVAVIAEHVSKPLLAYLTRMLHESRNLDAECLLHVLGANGSGAAFEPTARRGLRILRAMLGRAAGNEAAARCHVSDASGLSRKNLLTPRALVGLLRHVASTPRLRPLIRCLPAPGDPGATTRLRLTDLKAEVRMKTGSMAGISGLCGYFLRDGRPVACFAVLATDATDASARADAFVRSVHRALAGPAGAACVRRGHAWAAAAAAAASLALALLPARRVAKAAVRSA